MSIATRLNYPNWVWLAAGLALVAFAAIVIAAMGHPWICECGTVKLWHGDTVSSENSQHISDWYSTSHLLHGLIFYAGLWLFFRHWSLQLRAFIALAIEVGWEILENTPFIIERYRGQTIALDYYGDSVLNSVADIAFCMLGFWLALRLPIWLSLAVLVAVEVVLAYIIRDNLTLNVLMLIYPFPAVLDWQSGG